MDEKKIDKWSSNKSVLDEEKKQISTWLKELFLKKYHTQMQENAN